VSFEEDEEAKIPLRSWSPEPSTPPASPAAPVDLIDMSDLEDLDDIHLDVEEAPDQPEMIALEEDTLMMPSASVPVVERPSESDASEITFTLSEPVQEAAPLPVDPIETVSDLQLEGTEQQTSAEPEADLLINLEEFDLSDDEEDDRHKQP
jgi:hypothetical protein